MTHGVLNGRTGEYIRWAATLALGAVVAYFTAQGAVQVELAEMKARQESQFGEVLRRLDLLQQDVRELRSQR